MSINKIKEFSLHLNTFRNIDLLNQGLYQIRVRIYCKKEKQDKKLVAIPYYKTESKEMEDFLNGEDPICKPHNVIAANINNTTNHFVSKTFLIRYSDEEIELEDYCYFKLESETSNKIYYIDFELYFSELVANHLNFKTKQNSNQNLPKIEFKFVNVITITINEDNNYFQDTFIPILFQDCYSSVLNVNISTLTTDFKIRKHNISIYVADDIDSKERVIDKDKDKVDNKKLNKTDPTNEIKKSSPNHLLDFFITNDQLGKINLIYSHELNQLLPNFVDSIYDTYVISLINSYSLLRTKYLKLADCLISSDSRYNDLSMFSTILQFVYYSDSSDKEFPSVNEDDFNYNENKTLLRRFSKRLSSLDVDYVLSRVLLEISLYSSQVLHLWQKYLEMLRFFPSEYTFIMEKCLFNDFTEEIGKFIKKQLVLVNDEENVVFSTDSNQLTINNEISEKIRTQICKIYIRNPIEIPNLSISPSQFPILLEESYSKKFVENSKLSTSIRSKSTNIVQNDLTNLIINKSKDKDKLDKEFEDDSFSSINEDELLNPNTIVTKYQIKSNVNALHLVILVHGFQGNSYDMRLLKYNLSLLNSNLVFYTSSANQENTEADFSTMGEKLSAEVKKFIIDWNDGVMFKKISFIGFSIGGLIIRSALQYLKEYKDKFHSYFSLSSPHLGYMYSTNTLFNAGMWVLKKLRKCTSLEQLSLSDESELTNTCLYKLSEADGFEWFDHIVLVSSHQDHYAPFESTRIQLCDKSKGKDSKSQIYRKMANNLLGKLTKNSLRRVDVNFVINESNIDTFIGRTAHIQFLENQNFMRSLFFSNADIFT